MKNKLENIGINKDSKILIIVPHPDDESVFSAGFMIKAEKIGADVKLICLTKGGESTQRHGLSEYESLIEAREQEFNTVCNILGVDSYELLDFPDGGLKKIKDEIKTTCEKYIEQYKPDFVLAFEPDGVYGHPDHVTLSEVITEIHNHKPSDFKLIYTTVDERFHVNDGAKAMADDFSKISPIKPNLIIELSIFEMYKKFKALSAHKTQFGEVNISFLEKWQSRGVLRNEFFCVVE